MRPSSGLITGRYLLCSMLEWAVTVTALQGPLGSCGCEQGTRRQLVNWWLKMEQNVEHVCSVSEADSGRWKIGLTHAIGSSSFMDVQIMEKLWGKNQLYVSVCSMYFYTMQLFCVHWLMVEMLLLHAHLLKSDHIDNQGLELKQLYSTLFIIIFNILIRMWARDWQLFLRNMYLLGRRNARFRNR